MVATADEADQGLPIAVVPQDRHLLGPEVTGGGGIPVGVVHVPQERERVGGRGIAVRAEGGRVGHRPGLVAVAKQAEREAHAGDGEDEGDLVDRDRVVRRCWPRTR